MCKVKLIPWQLGLLDIHFIQTGRGVSAFYIFPDGTTLLVDAGDMSDTQTRVSTPRTSRRVPDFSRTAPGWIVEYIRRFGPHGMATKLDYALITHWHDDHFGEIDAQSKLSKTGAYRMSGIMEVGDAIQIDCLIDRGFAFPILGQEDGTMLDAAWQRDYVQRTNDDGGLVATINEYLKFVNYHKRHSGMRHELFTVGSCEQLVLKYAACDYPRFRIRNLCGGGRVWTGEAQDNIVVVTRRDENNLSAAFKLNYDAFKFFTGGDISGMDKSTTQSDMDSMEAHVAPLIGAVDVATLNHHGSRDSCNPYYVRTLRPRVWIGQSWSSDQPGEDAFRRLISSKLYPNARDLYATDMLDSLKLVIGDVLDESYRSLHGHIVVRVQAGGQNYSVSVLDMYDEQWPLLACRDYLAR
ncbi:MAG: MBL fold metallo-hydrolase [Bacillota bacterium]